jgi:transcriptional regulator with XRE-family HTH domain
MISRMTGGQPIPHNPWPLGDQLRSAREEQQLTQTAAAQRADISRTVWQQLESGVRADGRPFRPKAATVQSAAVAVGLDPRDALQLAGLDPTLFRPARGGPVASQREAADLISRLTGAQRRALVELLHTLVDVEDGEAGELASGVDELRGVDE